jgi:hypothetical protein
MCGREWERNNERNFVNKRERDRQTDLPTEKREN